ncbi:MAG: hypothetical protein ACOX6J_06810 [Oscillospiraceae bacterium]|jgi:hypothetical protein
MDNTSMIERPDQPAEDKEKEFHDKRIYTIPTLLLIIVMCIPLVGLIVSCSCSFTMKNRNNRAIARAFMIINIVVTICLGILCYFGYRDIYKPYKEGGLEAVVPNVVGTEYEGIAAAALGLTEEQVDALANLDEDQKDAAITGDFSKLSQEKMKAAAEAYGTLYDIEMTVGLPDEYPQIFETNAVQEIDGTDSTTFIVYDATEDQFDAACETLADSGWYDMGGGTETDADEPYTWRYFVSSDLSTRITISIDSAGRGCTVTVEDVEGTYTTEIGSSLPDGLDGHVMSVTQESGRTTYLVFAVSEDEASAYYDSMGEQNYRIYTSGASDYSSEYHLSGRKYCSMSYDSENQKLTLTVYESSSSTSASA